uniref:Secreted protein n=1 Tax=Caenorhabditis tropicalis TaxID=1561998 RepID=A0A1I7V035_9PELO
MLISDESFDLLLSIVEILSINTSSKSNSLFTKVFFSIYGIELSTPASHYFLVRLLLLLITKSAAHVTDLRANRAILNGNPFEDFFSAFTLFKMRMLERKKRVKMRAQKS